MDRWLNILLIDDDEDDYIITRDLLSEIKHDQFELDWVTEYDQALDAMCANEHDAYLLDYRLGPYNGLDLLRDAIESGCTAPIIVLTGQGDPEVDVEAMQSGAAEYLVKGELTPELLERTIRYTIEHKEIERELAEARERLAESRERERLRLAQELHDGPVQDLYGARFRLKSLLKSAADDNTSRQLADVEAGLQDVTRTLRAICGELRPPTLAPFGLDVAIRSHVEQFQAAHSDLNVELELDAGGLDLNEDARHALYRIYQHAISNVVKHAGATHVRIHLSFDGNLRLEIEDDGCGFEVPERWTQLARNGHLGLLGAAERAESVGGTFEVQSTPGEGTCMRVVVPASEVSAPADTE